MVDKEEVLKNRNNIRAQLKKALFLPQKKEIINNSVVSTEPEGLVKSKKKGVRNKAFSEYIIL